MLGQCTKINKYERNILKGPSSMFIVPLSMAVSFVDAFTFCYMNIERSITLQVLLFQDTIILNY